MSQDGAYIHIKSAQSIEGHDENFQRCEEILSSEVHKCPIKHLSLVVDDCAELPLKSHHQKFVRKLRAHVADGIESASQICLVT